MATGSGAGGDDGSDKDPRKNKPSSGHENDLTALLNVFLIALLVNLAKLREIRNAVKRARASNVKVPTVFNNADSRSLDDSNLPSAVPSTEINYRRPGQTVNFKPSSDTNYLPALLVQAAGGRVVHRNGSA